MTAETLKPASLQGFGLEMNREFFQHFINIAFHHLTQLVKRQADTMIAHPFLREIGHTPLAPNNYGA